MKLPTLYTNELNVQSQSDCGDPDQLVSEADLEEVKRQVLI